MFKNKSLLIVCFFCIFFSCKKDMPITFLETNFTFENNSIVEVNIPFANQNSEIAKSINSTIKDYTNKALLIGETDNSATKSVEKSIDKFNEDYNSFINDFPKSSVKWEAQIDGEVIFKTQKYNKYFINFLCQYWRCSW